MADLRAALLEPGADVNFFEAGTHALFLASTAGHAPAVKLLHGNVDIILGPLPAAHRVLPSCTRAPRAAAW